MRCSFLCLMMLTTSVVMAGNEPTTVVHMQWQRRVLIIATAVASDPQYREQLQALANWRGGDDRDLTIVRIEGDQVMGAVDRAKELRERYQLPASQFSATLIGKDGHVASRSAIPVSGNRLEGLIDAMPMRKAGER